MATEAVKSTALTNLDASPPVRATSGAGGAEGGLRFVDGKATFADTKTSGSTYAMVRVPSNAVIKRIRACIETAVTTFTVDIGVYYSTGPDTPTDLQGDVIDADLFGSAVALASVVTPTEYTMESTQLSVTEMFYPLWQAAGLTSDPRCSFDIVLTNTATNDTTSDVYLSVEYVLAGA